MSFGLLGHSLWTWTICPFTKLYRLGPVVLFISMDVTSCMPFSASYTPQYLCVDKIVLNDYLSGVLKKIQFWNNHSRTQLTHFWKRSFIVVFIFFQNIYSRNEVLKNTILKQPLWNTTYIFLEKIFHNCVYILLEYLFWKRSV